MAEDSARPTRVLVVDDEPSPRAFVARVLGEAGYAVDTAASGLDALSIVEHEGTFNLFVIDVTMPEMVGYELARQLRQREPGAKVLYFTGYAASHLREKHLLWEDETFLEKPVSVAGLRDAVSLLLFDNTHGPAQ